MRPLASALVLAAVALAGCAPPLPPEEPAKPSVVRTPIAKFRYDGADGGPEVSTESLRGRLSVVAIVATYDMASQAEVKFLTILLKNHRPRINAAAIALDPPENRLLVGAFRDSLHLPYPVALGDVDAIAGNGPFGHVTVPTIVVLDADGRLVWKHKGLATDEEIEKAIAGL